MQHALDASASSLTYGKAEARPVLSRDTVSTGQRFHGNCHIPCTEHYLSCLESGGEVLRVPSLRRRPFNLRLTLAP